MMEEEDEENCFWLGAVVLFHFFVFFFLRLPVEWKIKWATLIERWRFGGGGG